MFILNPPTPLIIVTQGLGNIIFPNWTVSTIESVKNILGSDNCTDAHNFVLQFVAILGRSPSDDDELISRYDNGSTITNYNSLTKKDVELISSEYLANRKNNILYWRAYADEDAKSINIERKENESYSEYFYRIVKLSAKNSLNQAQKMFSKFRYFTDIKSKLANEFNNNQLMIGTLTSEINEIGNAPLEHLHRTKFSPSPIDRSNELLEIQSEQLQRLSSIMEKQSQQAVLLNKQTELLLNQSIRSSTQAKNAVWIAVISILFGSLFSIYSIYQSAQNGQRSDNLLNRLSKAELRQIDIQADTVNILRELKSAIVLNNNIGHNSNKSIDKEKPTEK